ncbi:uncharacterized protein K452DRAFT_321817 [Aplosporella prunicola CBS 121167]|uniref:Uncharacterized protein n=1 Tax=Aplosporella prunicola CBS 121167 TaxID=1176127 RepID=A0A6A6AZQ4_9PEZI|nr:uncharacterized protein K452DRAFT_321817 [Aplosporella prunicola CBS 121167]KAF2137399.1 hypothetical protein K452DRAFT_321817 [Aplosporella prunicola CBS 121167]
MAGTPPEGKGGNDEAGVKLQPTGRCRRNAPLVQKRDGIHATPDFQSSMSAVPSISTGPHESGGTNDQRHSAQQARAGSDKRGDDAVFTSDTATSNTNLQRPFDAPILHRLSKEGPTSFRQFDLPESQDYLRPGPDEEISASDTSSSSTGPYLNSARFTTIKELLTRLAAKPGIDNTPPTHFYRICNHTNFQLECGCGCEEE